MVNNAICAATNTTKIFTRHNLAIILPYNPIGGVMHFIPHQAKYRIYFSKIFVFGRTVISTIFF